MLSPKVTIFIATYNGQSYLAEQIDSIIAQTHKHWEIWISDDGSNDETHQIVQNYQKKLGNDIVHIKPGPCKGYAINFLSLTNTPNIQSDYYAYSDQDDIWAPDKLEKALARLETVAKDTPALYCSRTELIDEHKNHIGFSPVFQKKPSFLNALVQNIGGGNTMVFNDAAIKVLRNAGHQIDIIAHDWWTYMVITGAGGTCFYDPTTSLLYRQHSGNLIGANIGWKARIHRIGKLFDNHYKAWNDKNTQALLAHQHILTEKNKRVLNLFATARKKGLVLRTINLYRSGIYRQTLLGNLGLIVACLFNKI